MCKCVAVYYSVLQCAAVCCSLLQCVVEGDSFLFTLCLVCVRAHTQVDLCITIRCVYCSVLQCVAVCFTRCCSELHLTITQHTCRHVLQYVAVQAGMCVAMRCSMLQYEQVCALQCVAVCCTSPPSNTHSAPGAQLSGGVLGYACCSMLQYVAICCSMLQYVAVCCTSSTVNTLCARCAI